MYKFGLYIFKDYEEEKLPKTKITISPRWEGTYNVSIVNLPYNEKSASFLRWMGMLDVWNLSGGDYLMDKYEFPKEMKEFLYGETFKRVVWRFLGDVEIIKY